MGTVDAMVGLLTVWTSISVVLVGTWHAHVGRRRPAFAVAEPRSHVHVIEHLAPVVDLDAVRSMRRSA